MKIILTRHQIKTETFDGSLTIGRHKVCDTAENATCALAPGTYRLTIVKCELYVHQVVRVEAPHAQASQRQAQVHLPCPATQQEETSSSHDDCTQDKNWNTPLPFYSPMIIPGNGVHNRRDGRIVVGTYIAPGCVKHPLKAFTKVFERVRKCTRRGKEVTLEITEG